MPGEVCVTVTQPLAPKAFLDVGGDSVGNRAVVTTPGRNLFDVLKNGEYRFFWITDGNGWKTAAKPLRETFGYT